MLYSDYNTSVSWNDIEKATKTNIATISKDIKGVSKNTTLDGLSKTAGLNLNDTKKLLAILNGLIKNPSDIIPVVLKLSKTFLKNNKVIFQGIIQVGLSSYITTAKNTIKAGFPDYSEVFDKYIYQIIDFTTSLTIDGILQVNFNDKYLISEFTKYFPDVKPYSDIYFKIFAVVRYISSLFKIKSNIIVTTNELEKYKAPIPEVTKTKYVPSQETLIKLNEAKGRFFKAATDAYKAALTETEPVIQIYDAATAWKNWEAVNNAKLDDEIQIKLTNSLFFLARKVINNIEFDFTPFNSKDEFAANLAHWIATLTRNYAGKHLWNANEVIELANQYFKQNSKFALNFAAAIIRIMYNYGYNDSTWFKAASPNEFEAYWLDFWDKIKNNIDEKAINSIAELIFSKSETVIGKAKKPIEFIAPAKESIKSEITKEKTKLIIVPKVETKPLVEEIKESSIKKEPISKTSIAVIAGSIAIGSFAIYKLFIK